MSDNEQNDSLSLQEQNAQAVVNAGMEGSENSPKNAADLEAVFDVPVRVSAILGRAKMPVSDLLNLDVGNVLELDRKVGEAVDIYVNSRLVARGEVVLVEDKLGVTMTEIIKSEK
ncbi:flagellar motor switch protein FliN [uncultured Cohaesibacter sp.]|uniref:flagellar motor switch protein FliN n=1 Tax=uncultured Cohaesibacter sp. TaxID=1002546 RepID=UPI00292E304F|nr:flagellar motor switch protein FliN [uncultured Cohaesibacter sp.]